MTFTETWEHTPDAMKKMINHDGTEEMECNQEMKLLEVLK